MHVAFVSPMYQAHGGNSSDPIEHLIHRSSLGKLAFPAAFNPSQPCISQECKATYGLIDSRGLRRRHR